MVFHCVTIVISSFYQISRRELQIWRVLQCDKTMSWVFATKLFIQFIHEISYKFIWLSFLQIQMHAAEWLVGHSFIYGEKILLDTT